MVLTLKKKKNFFVLYVDNVELIVKYLVDIWVL